MSPVFVTPAWRLACGWITMFVVGTDLFIISPLLPQIATAYDRSAVQAGLSVTVFSLAYLLCAPLIGQMADRTGRRRTLILCLLGFAAANLLTAVAAGFGGLLLARIAAGVTTAGVSPLIYAGVGEAAPPDRRATWMAIAVSGLLLALSIGAPIGTMIAAVWGWRAPFLVLTVLSLLLIVANRLVWPADARAAGAISRPSLNIGTAAFWLLPTVLWATALYGMYTYLGTWLIGAGLPAARVARAVSFYGLGALAGTLLGGQAADRFGSRSTMLTSLGGLAVGLLALGIVGTGWAADAVLLLASMSAQLFFPAQQARLARQFPQRRAFMLALNNSSLFLGISIGSVIGGEAMARVGFAADTAVGTAIACGALVLVAGSERQASIEAVKTEG